MATRRPIWRLYIDESGDFGDPDDPVSIGGVMIRDDVPGSDPQTIRTTLNRLAPGFPWPWHARLLNQRSWVAMALLVEAERGASHAERIPAPVLSAASDCLDFLQRTWGQRAKEAIDAIRAGRKPHFEAVKGFSKSIVNGRRGAAQVLDGYIQQAWAAVGETGAGLAAAAQRAGDPATAVLVLASETWVGDAAPESASDESVIDAERYATLLRVTVARAAALLAGRPGTHTLHLHVLERHVTHPVVRGRVLLQLPVLQRLLAPVVASMPSGVTVVPAEVSEYSSQVGIRYVLADFVTNRARRELNDPYLALQSIERNLVAGFALPARSGSPPRSHLAASSPESAGGSSMGLARRWAREQASEWRRAS